MNLLKVTFLVVVAASLALLLSNHAIALDHPWDDGPADTTVASSASVDGGPNVGSDTSPDNDPIYVRVPFWLHWFFGGFDTYIIGQKVQQAGNQSDGGSKHISGKVLKPKLR
jgi:hypothetical protein